MALSEAEIASGVVTWLTAERWDVYQEVKLYGSIADIVAVQGQLVWIIEVKTSLGLSVIGQAMDWLSVAHFVSVATPRHRAVKGKSYRAAHYFLRHLGVGRLEVIGTDGRIEERERPRLRRFAKSSRIIEILDENHKTFAAAGNAEGSFWTPFKGTCRHVLNYVQQHPGQPLRVVVENIDHHYRSDAKARHSLSKWIREGIVPGVKAKQKNGKLLVYPARNKSTTPKKAS